MVYTEIKKRNDRKYFYRVKSVRKGDKVNKIRVYLGADLNKSTLKDKEILADKKFKEDKTDKNFEKLKGIIIKILKEYNIKRAGIFGSYARDEQKKNSDIDILIKIDNDMSLLDFVRLKRFLEEALKRKIDLVEYDVIKPQIKERILKEEIRII